MVQYSQKLYHCHKLNRNVYISEEYEVIDGVRTLVRCSCPFYTGTAYEGRRCDGMNDLDSPCGPSLWTREK